MTAAILAGCISDDPANDVPPYAAVIDERWAERALPFGTEHDHDDTSHHVDLSTPNFELLGFDGLVSPYLKRTASGHLCGDVGDRGEQKIGVVHAFSDAVAFTVVDLTDPRAPVQIGEFVLPNTGSRDVALTEDGMFVAIAVSTPPTPPRLPGGIAAADGEAVLSAASSAASAGSGAGAGGGLDSTGPYFHRFCDDAIVPVPDRSAWRPASGAATAGVGATGGIGASGAPAATGGIGATDAVAAGLGGTPESYVPYPPGVMLVSIEDPRAPAIVDFYALPILGGHSVTGGDLDGTQVIVASVVNLATAASNFWFFEVASTPLGTRLLPAGFFQDSAAAANAPLINGHNDAWIQVHPVTGQHLAYLANWNQGVAILDISNLANPQVIGRWYDNPGPNAETQTDGIGSVHNAFPMHEATADGRHYTFIGQEILVHPAATPSGWVKVLDTTDPTDPHVVATWTLPVDVEWSNSLVWSTHYVDYFQNTLFVAHYHAGVWAIDISDLPNNPFPPAIGVFVPALESPAPPQPASYDWAPTIMDANVLSSGELVVWDSHSGVYVVKFHEEFPAPARVWPGYVE
jgi:hypothetical protein